MKAKLIRDMPKLVRKTRNGKTVLLRVPAGHKLGEVIEEPNVYLLVRQGVAEPADEECRKAANMTPAAFAAAKKAYEKTSKGIHPEDYDAFERGLMRGYKPDGKKDDSWIPGPSWAPGCEAHYYDSMIDDEDDDEDDDEQD